MTTAQKLESLLTELGAQHILLGTHLSTLRYCTLADDRAGALDTIVLAMAAHRHVGACVAEIVNLQPGAGAATPPAAATHTLPVLLSAPGPASPAGTSAHGCADTRGGICANCREYSDPMVPSLNGQWWYCMGCAAAECAEEAPAAIEDDSAEYLYERDPDELRDEQLDRRMDERRAS